MAPTVLRNSEARNAIPLTWYHEHKTTPLVYKTIRALLPPVLERRNHAGDMTFQSAVPILPFSDR
jgi:hypothetical protein